MTDIAKTFHAELTGPSGHVGTDLSHYGHVIMARYLWLAYGEPLRSDTKGETWICLDTPDISGTIHCWLVCTVNSTAPQVKRMLGCYVVPMPHASIDRGLYHLGGAPIYTVQIDRMLWWIDTRRPGQGPSIPRERWSEMIEAVDKLPERTDPVIITAHAIEQWLATKLYQAPS